MLNALPNAIENMNVLIVDDSEDDAFLTARTLRAGDISAATERVASRATMTEALDRRSWDLVLCDYNLPGFSMEEALELVQQRGSEIPFLVVSGTIGEEKVAHLMQLGVSNVVLKENIGNRLAPTVRREIAVAATRKSAVESERARRATEQQLLDVAANVPGLVYRRVMQTDGTISYPFVAGSFLDLLGVSRDLAMRNGFDPRTVSHPADLALLERVRQSAIDLSPLICEWRMFLPSGEIRWLESRSVPRREADGSVTWDAVAIDITERHRSAEGLRLLQQLSLAIAEAADFDTALVDVLHRLCDSIGWPYSEAWRIGESTGHFLHRACWHVDDPIWTQFEELRRHAEHGIEAGMIGFVWQTGQPSWHSDVVESKQLIGREKLRKCGVLSIFAVPIKVGEEVLAVLSFASREIRHEDSRLLDAVSAIAAQLGVALKRKQSEQELHDSKRILEHAQEIASIGSWLVDPETGKAWWSKQVYRICGIAAEDYPLTAESRLNFVHPDDREKWLDWHASMKSATESITLEYRFIRPDGQIRLVSVEGKSFADKAGGPVRVLGTLRDITESRLVEEQLAHAQKIETIGALTSGISHDFNNILSVIMSNLEVLAECTDGNPDAQEPLADAQDAAERGAELIRGLLGAARKRSSSLQTVDVNLLVGETTKFLSRLLGRNIEVTVALSENVGLVITDSTQLKMAIANLATNARDAMPNGGRLTISTSSVRVTAENIADYPGATAGDYSIIEVADTGTGISPEDLEHIFEPFFTTKAAGKGTGLGLSMVATFLNQCGGQIQAASEAGRGATFTLMLPRVTEGVSNAKANAPGVRHFQHGKMCSA
jgi:PAS domain S-box-containing protein